MSLIRAYEFGTTTLIAQCSVLLGTNKVSIISSEDKQSIENEKCK